MNGFSTREFDLIARGMYAIAGVDEAGRGPLAGPVIAAAVIFDPSVRIDGVGDSKTLTAPQREHLAARIMGAARSWAIGAASPREIDERNILQASILAMHRAIEALSVAPDFLLVDGNRFHHPLLPFETVIKGDALCFSIAAASILAKVERDRLMCELDAAFPAYGFARHKGYPTKAHIEALCLHGPCEAHRRSFTVKSLTKQQGACDERQKAGTRTERRTGGGGTSAA
ncbi:MAG: ribonuclease HII [Bacteroidetes bacterium]|nr:ribonuclease HII [Bacteroidota bacterium]